MLIFTYKLCAVEKNVNFEEVVEQSNPSKEKSSKQPKNKKVQFRFKTNAIGRSFEKGVNEVTPKELKKLEKTNLDFFVV